jgi:hypothetical protein
MDNIGAMISELFDGFNKKLSQAFAPISEFFGEKYIQNLTKDGWYLSTEFLDEFGIIGHSMDVARNWDDQKRKDFFYQRAQQVIYEEGYLNQIQNKFNEIAPDREDLSKEMFEQFRSKNYYSFITLCLSQVNGLTKEIIEINFFSSENRRQKIGNEEAVNSLFSLIKDQLYTGDRNDLELIKEGYIGNGLNRHSIMHGESINFGTEENGIKAILLLDFTIELCKSWKNRDLKRTS